MSLVNLLFKTVFVMSLLLLLQACSSDSNGPDITPPVLTLNGDQTVSLFVDEVYVELGASATDDVDGELSVIVSGDVDPSTIGAYTVRYSATDSSGNTSSIERTVNVIAIPDTTAPQITLNGRSTVQLLLGEEYVESGATANDDIDGAVEVEISGSVDTEKAGTYTIEYFAVDLSGNQTTIERKVIVEIPRPFITTWDTRKPGVSKQNQIKIDTYGEGFNYSINWGDGSTDTNVTGDITHTYAAEGVYQIEISGDFPHFYMAQASVFEDINTGEIFEGYESDNQKLLSVDQWGTNRWRSMHSAFRSTTLTINAVDTPYMLNVDDMSFMFACDSNLIGCVFNQEIGHWDVSTVQNMKGLFSCPLFDQVCGFNQDISDWDVSKVTDMSGMFFRNVHFDQDISSWNVASVKSMNNMFFQSQFNQDIGGWDVSEVTDMNNMFYGATEFNQDIGRWNVSNVTTMAGMFYDATKFNQDIGGWNVANVTSMGNMFRCLLSTQNCAFNQNLENWNVARVKDMRAMFAGAENVTTSFDQNIGSWILTEVKRMDNMFDNAKLSVANYDALLLGWSAQALPSDIKFSAGNSQYSTASAAARQHLIEQFNWNIIDNGLLQQQF